MRQVKVRVVAQDDDTLYRAAEVRFSSSHSMGTPFAVADAGARTRAVDLPSTVGGFNEMYRTFSAAKLPKLMSDGEEERRFLYGFSGTTNYVHTRGDINLVVPAVDAIPKDPAQVEYIADTVYPYADVLSTPCLTQPRALLRGDPKSFAAYKTLVDAFLDDIERLNNKVVMGVIPPLAYDRLAPLIDSYLERGMNAFAVDLDARSPRAEHERNLRPLIKRLRDQGLEEDYLLYALNAQTGRPGPHHRPGVQPAQDVLAFGFGFDMLGLKHRAKKMSKDALEALKGKPKTVRFFDRTEYSYRGVDAQSLATALPSDTEIPTAALLHEKAGASARKLLCMEQLSAEARDLVGALKGEYLIDHVTSKREVTDVVVRNLRSARESTDSQTSLDGPEWL